ncbi:unnamed protein product [Phytophthora fragariaefolia]|uniref:Unnamed protein product n=1 Tax=Phytophthora fragariaefolia TaxID=1490495 RepID=A0A9W6XDR9_9STRA|nr:unnamed protein product [Phytophthora fragariaefolia]
MADPLLVPFTELCGALRGLQEQVEQLARVHEAVDDFNSAFGAFQGAMALHASCLTYPRAPKAPAPPKDKQVTPGTSIPRPSDARVSSSGNGVHTKSDATSNSKNKARGKTGAMKAANGGDKQQLKKPPPVTGMKRSGKLEPHGPSNTRAKRRKTQMAKAAQPAWTWERRTFMCKWCGVVSGSLMAVAGCRRAGEDPAQVSEPRGAQEAREHRTLPQEPSLRYVWGLLSSWCCARANVLWFMRR